MAVPAPLLAPVPLLNTAPVVSVVEVRVPLKSTRMTVALAGLASNAVETARMEERSAAREFMSTPVRTVISGVAIRKMDDAIAPRATNLW